MKNEIKNKNTKFKRELFDLLLAMIFVAVSFVASKKLWVSFYNGYAEVFVNDVLNGAITGKTGADTVFLSAPLSYALKTLYELIPSVCWFALFLTGVSFFSSIFIVKSIVGNFEKVYEKAMAGVLTLTITTIGILESNVFLDFKDCGTIALFAAIIAYLNTEGNMRKCDSWAAIVLAVLGTGLNSEMFPVFLALLVVTFVICEAVKGTFGQKIGTKEYAQKITLPVCFTVGGAFCILSDALIFKRADFKIEDQSGTVIVSLFVLYLLSVLFLLVRYERIKMKTGRKVNVVLYALLVTASLTFLTVAVKMVSDRYKGIPERYNAWNEFKAELQKDSSKLYLCDENLLEYGVEKAYDNATLGKNFVAGNGDTVNSKVWTENIVQRGIDTGSPIVLSPKVYTVSFEEQKEEFVNEMLKAYNEPTDIYEYKKIDLDEENVAYFYSVEKHDEFASKFAEEKYDTLFLSEFDAKDFQGEMFNVYLGINAYFEDENQTADAMVSKVDKALRVNGNINEVWLLLDPFNKKYDEEKISLLCDTINMYSGVVFNVMLNYPGVRAVNERGNIDETLETYEFVCQKLTEAENVRLSFADNHDWILENAGINDGRSTDREVTGEIIGSWIVGDFIVNDNYEDVIAKVKKTCEEYKNYDYEALQNEKIVFFGDSVIGNYKTASGIANIVGYLSEASCENECVGGTSAAYDFGPSATAHFEKNEEDNVIYVINFGINDFLHGYNLYGEESYYEGLACGIEEIKKNDSRARIVLVAPYYSDNTGKEKEDSPQMQEFVKVCEKAAKDYDCYFINAYDELGINEENLETYVCEDHVHLNADGRMKYSKMLIKHLTEWME